MIRELFAIYQFGAIHTADIDGKVTNRASVTQNPRYSTLLYTGSMHIDMKENQPHTTKHMNSRTFFKHFHGKDLVN